MLFSLVSSVLGPGILSAVDIPYTSGSMHSAEVRSDSHSISRAASHFAASTTSNQRACASPPYRHLVLSLSFILSKMERTLVYLSLPGWTSPTSRSSRFLPIRAKSMPQRTRTLAHLLLYYVRHGSEHGVLPSNDRQCQSEASRQTRTSIITTSSVPTVSSTSTPPLSPRRRHV
jgi:hypothetical protein